ncbi:WapI family immunity protein, partial [Cellulomonas marina]|uniref:WapI family immunity protein n=1 Tax=Cellulomonas marina TaxID=988821 RepID=UPI00194499DE
DRMVATAVEVARLSVFDAVGRGCCEHVPVELRSGDGATVRLRPTGYQFGRGSGQPGDWDANWLMVRGEVRPPTGASWSFLDPCLTTWESAELEAWLHAASRGEVQPSTAPREDDGLLTFTEPNLAFSVQGITDSDVALRVHFSLESAPRVPDSDSAPELYEHFVALTMTRNDLAAAAESWGADISPFPQR